MRRASLSGRPGARAALSLAVAACGLLPAPGCTRRIAKPPAGSKNKAWTEFAGNPVIKIGDSVPHMLWNDPSVLQEGETYRMWLSGGDPREGSHVVVQVYEAESKDGLSWKIDPTPRLRAAPDPAAWDSLRIETPSVVKVGDTYHLYYSGGSYEAAQAAALSIGHATSPDGVNWSRDPANPIIARQDRDPHAWGYHGVGEPGVVYDQKRATFYLYYVSMRFATRDPTIGNVGILLATSRDGSHFEDYVDAQGQRALVLTRDVENARSGSWFGYSTPSALIAPDGRFHLFCSFIVLPQGPSSVRYVGLDHAVSPDGLHFEVVERSILEAGEGDWKDQHVRSPTVVENHGRLEMWFAGETRKPYFAAGIGFATREASTPAPERSSPSP